MNKNTPIQLTIIGIIVSTLWAIMFMDARKALYVVVILNMIGYILMYREYKQQEVKKC